MQRCPSVGLKGSCRIFLALAREEADAILFEKNICNVKFLVLLLLVTLCCEFVFVDKCITLRPGRDS